MNKNVYPTTYDGSTSKVEPGLTKREYFAVKALQGLTASGEVLNVAMVMSDEDKSTVQEIIAVASVKYADALIKELGGGE